MSAYGKAHEDVRTLYGPAFFAGRSQLVVQSAAAVVPVLMDMLAPRSVLDVGCGECEWLDAFPDDVCGSGVDIYPARQRRFLQHDLTEPLNLYRVYDLVLCLEVGEHIPEDAADTLVDTLVLHSDTVVFGAAVPGQEGTGHINCQPHEYWDEKFSDRGFEMFDTIRPRIAHDGRVSPWYRNNMFLYMRADDDR